MLLLSEVIATSFRGQCYFFQRIPNKDNLILLGDFNARVVADSCSWPNYIGHFGVGKLNENGQRLLELCSYNSLCIFSTFFSTKPHHRVSWTHPRSKHWHQLDFIITRKPMLNHVSLPRSYHSTDCDTDHSLIGRVRLRPWQFYRSELTDHSRINTSRVMKQELREQFSKVIDEAPEKCPTQSAQACWDFIRDAKYKAAIDTSRKRAKKNEDWCEDNIDLLDPAIAAKGRALNEYKRKASAKNLAIYREARNNGKSISRKCAND
ncbi:craniofacial development protein 2 [Elysia marginata]|uniref:Craniofacial development protein 2 n=1 Tax=Elysia marginata TaxID=1093978 RepID=A0AAV4HWZ1_9GAST|nr:craniofacial development protein 2 [Elysia marginata]